MKIIKIYEKLLTCINAILINIYRPFLGHRGRHLPQPYVFFPLREWRYSLPWSWIYGFVFFQVFIMNDDSQVPSEKYVFEGGLRNQADPAADRSESLLVRLSWPWTQACYQRCCIPPSIFISIYMLCCLYGFNTLNYARSTNVKHVCNCCKSFIPKVELRWFVLWLTGKLTLYHRTPKTV